MRHKKKGNHLGRTYSHKKALMRNLAAQVIEHKQITTTLAKAKELRGYVERLITYAKKGTVQHRRLAFKFLQDKEAVKSLFDELAPVYETRNGGYTRIIKLGNRQGDGAAISIFQLVGFETTKEGVKAEKAKKKKAKVKETSVEEPVPEDDKPVVEEKVAPEDIKEETKGPQAETSGETNEQDVK